MAEGKVSWLASFLSPTTTSCLEFISLAEIDQWVLHLVLALAALPALALPLDQSLKL